MTVCLKSGNDKTSYIVKDSTEVVEDCCCSVHAVPVILHQRDFIHIDVVAVQRPTQRFKAVQGVVGQQVDAVTTYLKKLYGKRPKTGHPVFGVFENPPVPKLSGFQTLSTNRTKTSGYRTSGSYLYTASNRTLYKPDVRNPDITSGFRTFGQLYLQTGLEPVLNRFGTGFQRSTFKIRT